MCCPLAGLTKPGRYHLEVTGDVTASSPPFRIGSATGLYGKLLRYGVRFDQVQRDGKHVIPGALHRKPAHLQRPPRVRLRMADRPSSPAPTR